MHWLEKNEDSLRVRTGTSIFSTKLDEGKSSGRDTAGEWHTRRTYFKYLLSKIIEELSHFILTFGVL